MNIPSHRQVLCFLEVCRDFHFTNAAKRLGIPQPPLSRHIKELEKLIGAQLFERSSRKVSLTPSGEVFLKEVYQVPATLTRAVDGARRAAAGETEVLRLGFVGAILEEELLEVFEAYRNRFSNTQLALVDLTPSELIRQVESGELDGALLGVRPRELPCGLNSCSFRKEKVFVCLPRSHSLSNRKQLKVVDLTDETIVALSSKVAPAYREFIDDLFNRHRLRPKSVRETNAAQAMLSMVVAGCGISFLPESVAKQASGKIACIALAGTKAKLEQVFLYSAKSSEALDLFVKLLRGVRA